LNAYLIVDAFLTIQLVLRHAIQIPIKAKKIKKEKAIANEKKQNKTKQNKTIITIPLIGSSDRRFEV